MAIIKKYLVEIINIENKVEGLFTITFKSLNGNFKFSPGQFLHLTLEDYDPSSGWPESRCFSIQSPPDNNFLKITYSIKGKFTTRMSLELFLKKKLTIKLPYGDLFSKEHNKENSIFIAGGTGITPFLSLFNSPLFSNYKKPILYFGLLDNSMNIYRDQLLQAQEINPELIIKYIFQKHNGNLNIEEIASEASSFSTFFISGPPQMINVFKDYLIINNISENNIITDNWE